VTARANVSSAPHTVLETPLPRDQASHYLRGGTGNEWHYVVEEGVFERALANDMVRLQELKWVEADHKVSRTGLRGGGMPKPKDPNRVKKPRMRGLAIFRKKANGETTIGSESTPTTPSSPSDFTLSSYPTRDFEDKSLEQRLYELSIASSDDHESIAFSNFTTPTWLLADDDASSQHSTSSDTSTIGDHGQRTRSLSLSSVGTVDSLWTPEVSPARSHGHYSFVSPGILVFKPEEAQPLNLGDPEDSELDIGPSVTVHMTI